MKRPRCSVRPCRDCGAPIRFAQDEDGKWRALDARPSQVRGNVTLERGVAAVLRGVELGRARDEGYDLYVSHFRSCPASTQARADRYAGDPAARDRRVARRRTRAAFEAARRARQAQRQPTLFDQVTT